MLLQFLRSDFGSIQLTVWEEMAFEEFQDGHCDSHLGYWKETIMPILTLHVSQMSPVRFRLDLMYRSGAVVRRFQNDGHLGYRNGTILAVLNFHVARMSPAKFRISPHQHISQYVERHLSR